MRSSTAALALLCCTTLACGGEARTAAPTPEPRATSAPEAADEPPATQLDSPTQDAPPTQRAAPPVVEAPAGDPVDRSPAQGATVEAAIDAAPEAVAIQASVTRGRTRYVLYTRDASIAARAAIEARDGADRVDVIDAALEDCDSQDDYSRFSCLVGVAPDVSLVGAAACDAREWGVAAVEAQGDGSFARTARRTLYALSCEGGASPPPGGGPTLRARDLDGDGQQELTARFAVSLLRDDLGMNGGTAGTLTFVLDLALHTQLRVTSEYESMVADVAGTTTTCQASYRLADMNSDGRDDATLRTRCTSDFQDDETGDSSSRPSAQTLVCPYDAARDAWICERDIAAWLFDSGDGSLAAERPELLNVRGLGAELPRVLAEARARDAEEAAEDTSAAPATDTRPPSTPPADTASPAPPATAAAPCVHVVQDPAPPLRVRATASARSEVVGELANGTELTLVERRGAWARIEAPVAGWVYTQNLRERCTP